MVGMVEGSLALVTGASSGMGRATCQVLAREGATVVVTCIVEKGVQETWKSLPGNGHMVMKYDVSDFKAIQKVLDAVIAKYGRPPNILVNCAGICSFRSVFEETPETFQRVIDVNLKGTFFTSQAVAKALVSAGLPGSIIHFSSLTGHKGFASMSPYASSKTGIEALTKCMAKDFSKNNIRVNDVKPGMIDTPMAATCPSEMAEEWVEQCSTQRKGRSEEVAEMVAFLASDRASYVNGAHITVAGGY